MTTYEMLGRERKASALLAVLVQCGITVEDAEGASQDDWKLAAKAAGTNPPSVTTQQVVISMLRSQR